MDLNDPLFTRSLPHKRNKRLGKGMVSVDNGSNSIAPHVQLYRMQRQLHSQGERGKKKKGEGNRPSFVTPSPLAPFMNILGILTRFPTTTISPFTNSGQPRASSSSRTPVVLVVDDDVSASLGTPTERASNSPNRRPNIKRDVNESREKGLVSPPVTDFHAIYFTIVQY